MNEHHEHISGEIALLQRRADQLTATHVQSERLLASLVVKAEAARSVQDVIGALRLDRRIHLMRRRRAQAIQEIDTLLELIAARRARYSVPTPECGCEAPPTPAGAE